MRLCAYWRTRKNNKRSFLICKSKICAYAYNHERVQALRLQFRAYSKRRSCDYHKSDKRTRKSYKRTRKSCKRA